ncbi:hypothetical protein pb186bvf_011314 [Paramecium bursaria]
MLHEQDSYPITYQDSNNYCYEFTPQQETEDKSQEYKKRRVDRYKKIKTTKINPKNTPKTLGNFIRKYVSDVEKKGYTVPDKAKRFAMKKQLGKQANYLLKDYRELCSEKTAQQFTQHYLENFLFIDILHSNRIETPQNYVEFLEQYLRGVKHPKNFISNRTSEQLALPQKKRKT